MAKTEYRQGSAGWWLLQRGWLPVKQRKPKNGTQPWPLWSLDGGAPVALSEAIEAEWGRINKEFERNDVGNNQQNVYPKPPPA